MASALVVDDSRQTADLLCEMLELLGVKAQPAYGALAAILWLKELIPDIIFMDLHMSGVDGFEVMAYLRRLPHLAEIPVVLVTSDDQPITARASQMGALRVIIKPATLDALEEAVERAKKLFGSLP